MRFNSRTLGRVRRVPSLDIFGIIKFQFTHPGKGATPVVIALHTSSSVSIHAPWEGCDIVNSRRIDRAITFQFTHPGKGATFCWRDTQ